MRHRRAAVRRHESRIATRTTCARVWRKSSSTRSRTSTACASPRAPPRSSFAGEHDLREVGTQARRRQRARRQRAQGRRSPAHHGAAHRCHHRLSQVVGEVRARRPATCSRCRTRSPRSVATLLRGGALNRARAARRASPADGHRNLRMFPARPPAHAHLRQPDMDQARELYQRAIALDAEYAPGLGRPRDAACAAYTSGGARPTRISAEADRASRIAMELAPELADAHLSRGYTLSNLRRYDEAREHFEAARASIRICSMRITTTAARLSPPATSRSPSSCGIGAPRCGATTSSARSSRRRRCASWVATRKPGPSISSASGAPSGCSSSIRKMHACSR